MVENDLSRFWDFGDSLVALLQSEERVPEERIGWIPSQWREDEIDGIGDMLCVASDYRIPLPRHMVDAIRNEIIPAATQSGDVKRLEQYLEQIPVSI